MTLPGGVGHAVSVGYMWQVRGTVSREKNVDIASIYCLKELSAEMGSQPR